MHNRLTTVLAEYGARRSSSQAYPSLTEYNTRRPSQDPVYLQYALPGAAESYLQQYSTAYDRQNDHMNNGASPIYHQPRATFEATPSNYHDFPSRRNLQVSYKPQRGTRGALVYIYLDSSSDLLSPIPLIATLMFATHSVPADLTRLGTREQDVYKYKYLASAPAPAFSETGSSNSNIPLSLQLQEQSTLDVSLFDIGEWLYEDSKQLAHRSSPHEVSRKRKVTDEPSDTPQSTKRATLSEQQNTQSQEYRSFPYPSSSSANPQSLYNAINTMERKYTAYGRSQLLQSLQPESNTIGSQDLIGGASTLQSLTRPPMGQTPSWNSLKAGPYQSGRNPQANAASSFQASSLSSPSLVNPTLVRTSTLAPQPSPGTASAGPFSDGSLNSYTLYPDRAVLEMRGDLDAMQHNWTPEERAAKRRIVRFWREQNGTTLNAYFKSVRADEQPLPHEHRISCMFWEEQNECYLTSCDTISILESLIGIDFDMKEKNRIRRNLQSYEPCTLSKGKEDSESFFKLVMGFSSPKPRHIEKSVKVFKWKRLEQALKKIISKYVRSMSLVLAPRNTDLYQCADPQSIPGPSRSHPSSNFSGSQSEAGADRYSALSSRSTSGSTVSGAYDQAHKSNTLSPPNASHALPSYSHASPVQQFPGPSLSHSYTVPSLSQYISNSPYAAQVSIPSLSSGSTASTMGRRRSSDAPTDDSLAPANYYSSRPRTITSFASPYTTQELSDAAATVALPGRASMDLSAYLNTDAASSDGIGGAHYGRFSGVKDEAEATQFKQE